MKRGVLITIDLMDFDVCFEAVADCHNDLPDGPKKKRYERVLSNLLEAAEWDDAGYPLGPAQ